MTPVRHIVDGKTYLLTRRTSERRFFLAPCAVVNQVYGYCLAIAAYRYGIAIHAVCAMSDHHHIVLSDAHGTLPLFAQWLHAFTARALNAHYERRESFWGPGSYNSVELGYELELLPSRDEVLDKMVYVLANPVKAGLVDRGSKWPGVRSSTLRAGRETLEFTRPDFFFRSDELIGSMELEIVPPPQFANLPPREFGALLDSAVEEREDAIRSDFAREGRKFLGRDKVMQPVNPRKAGSRAYHERRATSPEPLGKLRPEVASRDEAKRVERIEALRAFRAAYREALGEWKKGDREVVFPLGTYWMRVHHRARCESVPPDI